MNALSFIREIILTKYCPFLTEHYARNYTKCIHNGLSTGIYCYADAKGRKQSWTIKIQRCDFSGFSDRWDDITERWWCDGLYHINTDFLFLIFIVIFYFHFTFLKYRTSTYACIFFYVYLFYTSIGVWKPTVIGEAAVPLWLSKPCRNI